MQSFVGTKDDSTKLVCTNKEVDTLVSSALHGDFTAFDRIMSMYKERLYSVIYNMTFNHEDAADLTQEAFVKAFRSLSKFKRKSSFFTWLYRIGVNLTLTHLKRKELESSLASIKFLTEKFQTAKFLIFQVMKEVRLR